MKRLIGILVAFWAALSPAFAQESYGVVRISVCNMRDTPNFSAEMVSQALLGTPVHILSTASDNRWPMIETPDRYTGWVHPDAIVPMTKRQYSAWNKAEKVVVTALNAYVHERPFNSSPTISDAVAGDRFKLVSRRASWLLVEFPDGRQGYVSTSDAAPESKWRKQLDQSPEAILSTARTMLGFPYLWAGMSPKGMDCSGFVRTTLFMHGIIIPRDCSLIAPVGDRITKEEDLVPGDLLFFGRWRDDGTAAPSHVAFYLGEGRFIHSLGFVKIGSLHGDDPLFDAYNTGRYLFGCRILPFVDQRLGLNTVWTNPYYNE